MPDDPRESALQEAGGTDPAFGGQGLRVGQARRIIDGELHEVPVVLFAGMHQDRVARMISDAVEQIAAAARAKPEGGGRASAAPVPSACCLSFAIKPIILQNVYGRSSAASH